MTPMPEPIRAVWWKPWTWVGLRFDAQWTWLARFPTVPAKMFALLILDFLTFGGLATTVLRVLKSSTVAERADPLVLELWLAWFGFMAALHGVSYATYKAKRQTAWDGNQAEDTPPPSAPASAPAEPPVAVPLAPEAPPPALIPNATPSD